MKKTSTHSSAPARSKASLPTMHSPHGASLKTPAKLQVPPVMHDNENLQDDQDVFDAENSKLTAKQKADAAFALLAEHDKKAPGR